MEFNAQQIYEVDSQDRPIKSTKYIKVDCNDNTSWSCRVDGNFGLNVYEGTGPTDSLEVTFFDDDEKTAYGKIIFSYIDSGCLKHVTIPIFYSEKNNWLNIFPTEDVFSNSLTNEYKVFTLRTNIPQNKLKIYVPSRENYKYFITDNLKLYLIKTNAIDTRITLHTSVTEEDGSITVLEESPTN